MTWNEDIAKNAQKWADATGGQMKHSDKASRSDVGGFAYLGENLAFGDGVAGAKAVEMWYSEIKDTDGGKVTGFDHKTGHYTQNVWKASIALGCGEKGKLVVCQYGPGGNSGNYAENVLPPTKSEDACQAEGDSDEPEGSNDEAAEGNNNDEGEGNDNEEAQGNNDEKAKGNNDYYYSKGGDEDEGEGGNDEGEEGNNDEGEEGNNDEEAEGNNDEEPEPCGKVSAPTPGGPLADVYLKAHNKYRCMHGVPCMTWNEEIAKNAQKWADASGGQMKHSDKASRS